MRALVFAIIVMAIVCATRSEAMETPVEKPTAQLARDLGRAELRLRVWLETGHVKATKKKGVRK